jgi:hypothetical protein
VKILKAEGSAAGAFRVGESSHLADRHEQRYLGGARLCLQGPAYLDPARGTRPLYGSTRQLSLRLESSAWRPTAEAAHDPQMTGWQAALMRPMDGACPTAPVANHVDQL